jgi:DNA topoisomerase-3
MPVINKVWITEKREMALALAEGLKVAYGCTVDRDARDRYALFLSNGDAIGYLRGHMLENAPPDVYLTEEQRRGSSFEYLPLSPPRLIKWPKADDDKRGAAKPRGEIKAPRPSAHLQAVLDLVRGAREIVNAGDTDREGQLIVDELLEYAGVDPDGSTKPVHRFKHDDPDAAAIAALLKKGLDSNADPRWRLKRLAAEVRERGDWCMGMSASRAWSEVTQFRRMSAGRVQSPVLLLVVERDLKIENFKAVDYFVPVLVLKDGTVMRWHAREGCEGMPGFDDQGRIINRAVAEEIVKRILAGAQGKFDLAECVKRSESAPLPFDLSSLQVAAAKRFGMTLKEAGDAAQRLYSTHKMISYIGTDCRYLPDSVLQAARVTVQSLRSMFPQVTAGANLDLRSLAFNESKVDEHFAIIPTGKTSASLNSAERSVFGLVAKRFLAQFYPNHEFAQMRLGAKFGLDQFRASEREVLRHGWKSVEGDYEAEGEVNDAKHHSQREDDRLDQGEHQR